MTELRPPPPKPKPPAPRAQPIASPRANQKSNFLSVIRRAFLPLVMLSLTATHLTAVDTAPRPLAGADESTPSLSHYFSWIDNTNEGATERQTLANLDFFKWLHDEYGMKLDIYALDAGAIDAPDYYGSIHSDRFKQYFPHGLGPIAEKAKSFGCRLGIWLGPDGFGNTPEEEKARTDMLVTLCRDYNFRLFKVDAVCGQLRAEKQGAFIRMLKECRTYCPDLIVLNHRVNLGDGLPYVTTKLWGGEAYIDSWRANGNCAPHNRACALEIGIPIDYQTGEKKRLLEDHGVCFSSCLDYWEDDLVLQALQRNLILAPEMYGSPWFLRDDEFPKLARIYNVTRHYRDILVHGLFLPDQTYGSNAVSRGDQKTRIVTLTNPTWNPVTRTVTLDESLGLGSDGSYDVRRLHPAEEILGSFKKGDSVEIVIPAFRSYALLISSLPSRELGVAGCAYEIVRDVPGKPAVIKLLGLPGTTANISLPVQPRAFAKATLDGKSTPELLQGKSQQISFPGQKLKQPWYRKLTDLTLIDVPADAEALYEATCFSANNNAMEIRSKFRSGPTLIPQVKAARDAFFAQKLLVERGLWDRYLFDDDLTSYFRVMDKPIWGGALRIDMGAPTPIDTLTFRNVDDRFKPHEIQVSLDLQKWITVPVSFQPETPARVTVLARSNSINKEMTDISVNQMTADLSKDIRAIRYIRIQGRAENIAEIIGHHNGASVDRSAWHASNLFADYRKAPAKKAWSGTFVLNEAAKGSYLVVPCLGPHGRDGAYAALRIDGKAIGAPRRAIDYPINPWDIGNHRDNKGLSYFFPVTQDMIGKKIDALVLQFESEEETKVTLGEMTAQIWLTAYPIPYESKTLVLAE